MEDRIVRNSKVYSEMKTLSGNEDSWGLRYEFFQSKNGNRVLLLSLLLDLAGRAL